MPLEGTVINGVVVLDTPAQVPEGARVEVILKGPVLPTEPKPTLLSILELAGTVNDLPSDMALNHDHYLHGHPKK